MHDVPIETKQTKSQESDTGQFAEPIQHEHDKQQHVDKQLVTSIKNKQESVLKHLAEKSDHSNWANESVIIDKTGNSNNQNDKHEPTCNRATDKKQSKQIDNEPLSNRAIDGETITEQSTYLPPQLDEEILK